MSVRVIAESSRRVIDDLRTVRAAKTAGERELSEAQRYALDPLALFDRDRPVVFVWDAVGRRPVPFVPWEHQRAAIGEYVDREHLAATGELRFRNIVGEKSRQMGMTWAFAYVCWWALEYHVTQGMALHVRGADVDDGGERSTVRSFVGKIRFFDRACAGAGGAPGAVELEYRARGSMPGRVRNPARPESFLIAESATADPGRGGTFTHAVVDEAAFVPWGESMHAALSRACPRGRAYLSTPNGSSNVHARLSSRTPQGYRYRRDHWTAHPAYREGLHVAGEQDGCELCEGNRAGLEWDPVRPEAHRYPGRLTSPWYDEAVLELTDEQVAQELEIDRSGALVARVYAEFSVEQHVHDEAIGWDKRGGRLELAIDYGLDCTAVVVCQDFPDEYRVIGELEVADHTPDQVAAAIKGVLRELGLSSILTSPSRTRKMYFRGDPSGEGRSLSTGKSLVHEYALQGFVIDSPVDLSVQRGVNAVKRLLRGTPKRLIVCPTCERFRLHMSENKWPTDRQGVRKVGVSVPLDNEHNHMPSAFRYLVVSRFPPPRETPEAAVDDERAGGGGELAYRRRRATGAVEALDYDMSL